MRTARAWCLLSFAHYCTCDGTPGRSHVYTADPVTDCPIARRTGLLLFMTWSTVPVQRAGTALSRCALYSGRPRQVSAQHLLEPLLPRVSFLNYNNARNITILICCFEIPNLSRQLERPFSDPAAFSRAPRAGTGSPVLFFAPGNIF